MGGLFISATRRLITSIVAGIVVGVGVGLLGQPALGALIGITVVTSVFVVLGTVVLWPMDAEATRANANREDFRPFVDEVIVTIAQLLGIGGIVALLVMGGSAAGPWPAAIALLGVFMSWAGLQLLYSVRYAFMYFDRERPGGIDFNSEAAPNYQDFLYFGFAVGMTFGVTDTSVSTTRIRAVVLRHSILSYLFNAVILATAINLVVGVFAG
ncbi:DUF1345 domain-containing protein [Brevibacterium oceani]|uniref:DUF1345 domain-containing protein n=1 Tax=Brevibacterium oceani TaxID=358099 RepID=UPI0015E66E69|nr:DUF1345 domain-containing protein [Brevibacterium oceani]